MSAFIQPVVAPNTALRTQTDDITTQALRKSSETGFSKLTRKDSLSLWHRVTVATVVNNAPDLTARQLAVVMSVYLEDGPHTVRSLAKQLRVTKAVIVRAIDKLCKLDFVQRAPDHRDKRSIILIRTSAGIRYLSGFADIIQSELPD
ncbi:MarR family transcriptional regulator [Litorimonas sp. RW-G-Af-16]|uniref:MarR family transcriptional regulator n=1 Tax=Litorimonas sp. RW-G-Af-16 TaxID=3241168 RepID=UPI00390C623C